MDVSQKSESSLKKEIQATYYTFDAFRRELTSIEYVLSEFIDNSLASWENGRENCDFGGLEISINIEETSNAEQIITITDNALGMSQEELANAIQPFREREKGGTQINQYGVGMKLGIFWLGRSVHIHTKQQNKKEYKLNLDLTNVDLDDHAIVYSEVSDDQDITTHSGTIIRIVNVYKEHAITKNSIDQICESLGSRYRNVLKKPNVKGCDIRITFIAADRVTLEYEIRPFFLTAYSKKNLFDVMKLQNKKKDFREEEYEKMLEEQFKTINSTTKENMRKICGGRDIITDYRENREMYYIYRARIGGKYVNFHWGILAYPLEISKYNGIALFHHRRAIRHCPNIKTKDNNHTLSSYPFFKGDTSGGTNVKRRLFGDVDLTDIVIPDKNKRDFLWTTYPVQQRDLDNICEEICKSTLVFLNILLNLEKETIKQKIIDSPKAKTSIEKDTRQFYSKLSIVPGNGTELPRYIFKNTTFEFEMLYGCGESDDAFLIEFKDENVCLIKINASHKMWSEILQSSSAATKFKGRMLYPLSICFAICKVLWDKEKFPKKQIIENITDGQDFDDTINEIIKNFDGKDE